MVDFKEHESLVVIPKSYSIEISNVDICIAVILSVGFEKEEYATMLTKNNHHLISFNSIMQTMHEFKELPIKYLDYMALFFTSLSRTDETNLKDFLNLKNPSTHQSLYRLRNNFELKEVRLNDELFSLLYRKKEGNSNCQKIIKQFAAAMVLKSDIAAFNVENLISINSSFIKEFVSNQT